VNWKELEALLEDGYRLVARRRLLAVLDADSRR
jgi:hypothetical protein